jgi:hypothetical protein
MKLLLDQMDQLVTLFKPLCTDTETLAELHGMLHQEGEWPKAHYLATRIRAKALTAIKSGNAKAEAQYAFEEVCAQTIYNLLQAKQPFGPDTPYWIIPLALKFARAMGIDAGKITGIVTS